MLKLRSYRKRRLICINEYSPEKRNAIVGVFLKTLLSVISTGIKQIIPVEISIIEYNVQ